MPVSCVAFGCANRCIPSTVKRFYAFPANAERQKAWIHAVRRIDFPPPSGIKSHHRLCSDHFVTGW